MTDHAERRAAPAQPGSRGAAPPSLLDLMYEGFYALYLLKNGNSPHDPIAFAETISTFLIDVDRQAKSYGTSLDEVQAARYAFCAAADEIVLRSSYQVREAWQTHPLQLRLFGDQLAGEHFFSKLDDLRARGAAHLQALEVFHMCLLMGFQGRFAIDGDEKLKFMCTTLGHEIARMRGETRAFAPHAERPDQVANKLRSDLSLWVLTAVFALAGLGAYLGLHASLSHATRQSLAGYNDVIKLPPRAASVTITLP
ncbi:type IVB secretion system protein IcmH/DotU [Massilia sp. PWRC2]|uniref:type IVB secretion system protein IcmH/DotU n=1 Tax=Massilia sp. PWRC2 TaxID=2804626 RepID=UPI003CE9B049